MRTRLVFVRHGESVHSVAGVVGGPLGCQGLTERGQRQARRLAERLGAELRGDQRVSVYSSVLRRAVETARPIADQLATNPVTDCGLCTWHTPAHADGTPVARFQSEYALPGGGVLRPFEQGSETWADVVVRVGKAIMDIAHRHAGGTVVLVGHTETVNCSFHALADQPLYRAFDLLVAPASVTEWTTDDPPTRWPPARWTLHRFGETVDSTRDG